jgi:hypothetical protein
MRSLVKFSLLIAFAGIAAVTAGFTQTSSVQPKVMVLPPGQLQSSCPVALQAQHASGFGTQVLVGKGAVIDRGIGQRLQLTLSNSKTAAVSAIRITVHGWNGTGSTMPTAETSSNYATASQTVELKVNVGPHATAEVDAWVSGLTAADSIDLDEVSYAGGLSWRSSATEPCRIMPDPVMLISSK